MSLLHTSAGVPSVFEQAAVRVQGIAVRTHNALEFNPATARLPALWGRFFNEGVAAEVARATETADSAASGAVYGVYSHYESDFNGPYSVTAGVAIGPAQARAASLLQPDPATGSPQAVELQAGTYLAFEASGPMPGAIVAAWQQVWAHFEGKGPWKRRYGTDFECYLGPELGRVCIGVVAA